MDKTTLIKATLAFYVFLGSIFYISVGFLIGELNPFKWHFIIRFLFLISNFAIFIFCVKEAKESYQNFLDDKNN